MSKTNLPIGLFDSGVGGLTVLSAINKLLPNENLLYLGDNARLPYGTKSAETIIRYALQATKKLVSYNIKLLVIACNTASATALPALRKEYPDLPIIGVVEPGAIAACAATRTNKVAVIATESTTRGKAYEYAIKAIKNKAEIVSLSTPLLVPTAEEGWFSGELVEAIVSKYINNIFNKSDKPDTLVLGCTHFPLLKSAIQNVVGNDVALVDSAQTTALAVKEALTKLNLENMAGKSAQIRYLTTDDVARFVRTGSLFLQTELAEKSVELIDL